MESIVHFENDRFIGRTNFKSGLLSSIVSLSAKEVAGVAKICRRLVRLRDIFIMSFREYAKFFNIHHGVKITNGKDGIVIDMAIWLEHGFSAADVCYRVQENIINTASSMIDKKIKSVNIKIVNITVPYYEVDASAQNGLGAK